MLTRSSSQSLLPLANKHPLEGYLVYSRGGHWWSRLFAPLGHVSIVVRKGSQYVWIEFSTGLTDVEVFPVGADWRSVVDCVKVQKFRVWRKATGYRVPHLLQPFTCVEQCKAYLGIRKWWVLTPNQLYRYIHNGQSL